MTLQQDSTHETGVSDDTPRGNSDTHRARQRKANAALSLSIAGATWEEIAESLGFPTPRAAKVAVERALEDQLRSPDSKKFMRAVASKRLDRLSRSVMKKALDEDHPEHLNAVREARSLLDRQIKLHGLDEPTEFVVSNPTAVELERWVAVVESQRRPELEEADIFDAELVEDTVNDPSQEA